MKILMLNYEFPPLGGGAANANKHILERMSDIEGLKIDLVTSSKEDYIEEDLSEDITIYRLDVSKEDIHHWTQLEILRYYFKGLWKSRKLGKENDYDLIHAWFGFPCGLMALMLRKPYLVSLRGSDVPGYNERFSLQYILLKPVIKRVWKKAEKVIANSKGLKELAEETYDPGIEVIPNGVETDRFHPSEEAKGTDKELKLICVARLIPRKRISDILKSIESLDYAKLTLIGEGPEEEELKDLARRLDIDDRVEFKGYIPHEEISKFYRNSDLFVMPSLNEGMSNTVLEAMASGLPIITTQTGGTDELIEDNGVIVPEKKPGAISDAIKSYREHPEKLRSDGQKSSSTVEEFNWSAVAEEYCKVYSEIIER